MDLHEIGLILICLYYIGSFQNLCCSAMYLGQFLLVTFYLNSYFDALRELRVVQLAAVLDKLLLEQSDDASSSGSLQGQASLRVQSLSKIRAELDSLQKLLQVNGRNPMWSIVYGSQAGVAWGPFMGSYDATKEGHRGTAWASYIAKSVVRNGLGWGEYNWGFFAWMYLGLNCAVETARRKSDWVNATIAGATTGALASLRTGSGVRMLQTTALVSAIATAGDFIRPSQYPPTGFSV